MASLITLPAELKDDIIHYASRTDMLNLSKACRALREVACQRLYRDLTVFCDQSGASLKTSPSLVLLMRTLLESPPVRTHVRKIELVAIDLQRNQKKGHSVHLDSIPVKERALFAKAFEACRVP